VRLLRPSSGSFMKNTCMIYWEYPLRPVWAGTWIGTEAAECHIQLTASW
jgi:hypothetical protein